GHRHARSAHVFEMVGTPQPRPPPDWWGPRLRWCSPCAHRATENRSPGWQSSAEQSATSVVNRTAFALLFLRTERFARLTPTCSESWVRVRPRLARRSSMWQMTRGCASSISDHPFELVLRLPSTADCPAEDLDEDDGADPEVRDLGGDAVAHRRVAQSQVADDEVVRRHLGQARQQSPSEDRPGETRQSACSAIAEGTTMDHLGEDARGEPGHDEDADHQ